MKKSLVLRFIVSFKYYDRVFYCSFVNTFLCFHNQGVLPLRPLFLGSTLVSFLFYKKFMVHGDSTLEGLLAEGSVFYAGSPSHAKVR